MDRRQLDAYLERVAAETAEWVKANPLKAEEVEEEPPMPRAKRTGSRAARKRP